AGAVVRVNGVGQGTNFVSASKVTATIPSTLIVNQGTLSITATNPGSAASSPVTLTVAPNQPTITTLDPSSVPAGNQNVTVTLTVVGSHFVSDSVIKAGTTTKLTTFVDSSHLTAPITATDIKTAGTISITVTNPNNQVSPPATLTIANANLPTITAISPSSV